MSEGTGGPQSGEDEIDRRLRELTEEVGGASRIRESSAAEREKAAKKRSKRSERRGRQSPPRVKRRRVALATWAAPTSASAPVAQPPAGPPPTRSPARRPMTGRTARRA